MTHLLLLFSLFCLKRDDMPMAEQEPSFSLAFPIVVPGRSLETEVKEWPGQKNIFSPFLVF